MTVIPQRRPTTTPAQPEIGLGIRPQAEPDAVWDAFASYTPKVDVERIATEVKGIEPLGAARTHERRLFSGRSRGTGDDERDTRSARDAD